jgi:hypothetical protein
LDEIKEARLIYQPYNPDYMYIRRNLLHTISDFL